MIKASKFLTILCPAILFNACGTKDKTSSDSEKNVADTLSFMDVVKNRYSCRNFDSTQVKREHLDVILEAGRLAPTAKNLQGHHVYVCQSEESLTKIDSLTPCRYGAPTCLVVTWDATNVYTYPGDKYNSGAEDATIVATHMMLAAKSVGVESCWVNCFDPDALRDSFNISKKEIVLMILPIGYAGENAAPNPNHFNRKPLTETVTYF